jgi:L-amino acid N-acyltransferase YncA
MREPVSVSVSVRGATAADAEAIAAIYAPMVEQSPASFEEMPPDAVEVERRMSSHPRLPWLVAQTTGRVVGYAYAGQHRRRPAYRWSADSSVYVDESHHGRGVGRMLYERLIEEMTVLGYVSLFAGIALPNDASVGLHEAVGFRLVGVYRNVGFKHGRWRDVGWWQRLLVDPPECPADPRPWTPDTRA